jgi:hypothetical protein
MFHWFAAFLIIKKLMSLFQLFVASSRFKFFFFYKPAGASFGRSATSRKIDFLNSKLSTAIWGIK